MGAPVWWQVLWYSERDLHARRTLSISHIRVPAAGFCPRQPSSLNSTPRLLQATCRPHRTPPSFPPHLSPSAECYLVGETQTPEPDCPTHLTVRPWASSFTSLNLIYKMRITSPRGHRENSRDGVHPSRAPCLPHRECSRKASSLFSPPPTPDGL